MINPWFKFYGGEYLSDPKILQLNAYERSCWITLLCLAGQSNGNNIKFLSENQLIGMSGIDPSQAKDLRPLQKFAELDMVTLSNDCVTVLNWEKRQYSEGYARVKRFRDKQSVTPKITIEEKRREENREEKKIQETRETGLLASPTHSPKEEAQEFFNNQEAQLLMVEFLVSKGVQQDSASNELNKFISYWTEPNSTGKKQRWQMEKTFEIKRRLSTWFSRAKGFSNTPTKRERKIWD